MTLELIKSRGAARPATYTQVIAATGSRLVCVAGQVTDDAQRTLSVPAILAAQARQVFANVGRSLAAAGAGGGAETSSVACPTIHAEPFARMPSLHPRELGCVPHLHPGVLQSMPGTEDRPVHEASVRQR
jgi:Endoribonuclease L-PSP